MRAIVTELSHHSTRVAVEFTHVSHSRLDKKSLSLRMDRDRGDIPDHAGDGGNSRHAQCHDGAARAQLWLDAHHHLARVGDQSCAVWIDGTLCGGRHAALWD